MMKLCCLLALSGVLFAQAPPPPPTTPNIGLYVPIHGSFNWDTWYNLNWNNLDNLLSGNPTAGLNYTNPIASSVQRSINSKLSDLVSAKDFGATGDGSTDDTAALNRAITTATSRSVYIPCGTYRLTSGLISSLPTLTGLTLQGAGVDCTVLSFVNGNGISVTLANQFATFHARDFTIVTNAGATGIGISLAQTAGNLTPGGIGSSSDIFRVNIRGTNTNFYYAYGVSAVGVSNINFDSVTITGGVTVAGHGVGNGIALVGQTIGGTEYGAVVFNVAKCNFNYLGNGIVYGSLSQGLTVDQSNFTGDEVGILIPAGLGTPEAPDQLDVSNSQFFDFTAAIALSSKVNAVNITNNLFGLPAGSNGVVSALLNFTITGNTFVAAGGGAGGLVLQGSTVGTVAGNNFIGLTTGINMDNTTTLVNVTGNAFNGNSTNLVDNGTNPVILNPLLKSATGTRFLCVSTTGAVTASASACSGT